MYEYSVLKDMIRKISIVAEEHPGMHALEVNIRWGARCGTVVTKLRRLFRKIKRGTAASNAVLTIDVSTRSDDSWAGDIFLASIRLGKLKRTRKHALSIAHIGGGKN